jgi:orotidine-5'-phosphate decarboxylase
VALDVPSLDDASELLGRLDGILTGCKIGSQLFTAAGPAAVERARKRGFRVFLDLKYHDIPNTVAGAVREAARLGVFMLNVHASGGLAMMRAGAEAATAAAKEAAVPRPLLLGVTVLTSLDRRALETEVGVPGTVQAHVLRLAERARAAGLDGCVASPQEIAPLRLALGRAWVIVTPGIRPAAWTTRPARPPRPRPCGPAPITWWSAVPSPPRPTPRRRRCRSCRRSPAPRTDAPARASLAGSNVAHTAGA